MPLLVLLLVVVVLWGLNYSTTDTAVNVRREMVDRVLVEGSVVDVFFFFRAKKQTICLGCS